MKEKIKKLRELIEKYNYEYHVEDNPSISDIEFDRLFNELINLENEYPEYYDENSPTQRVGGIVIDDFKKIKHQKPMLSLGNVFSKEELKLWSSKIEVIDPNVEYCVELKIDGLAMSLVYNEGTLNYAVTRGDGETGEDVTNNIKTIKSVPLKINNKNDVEIRGEVFMPKKSFERINREREKLSEPLFANPRNAAAGSIRQLDSKVVSKRGLDMFSYHLVDALSLGIDNHYDSFKWLKDQGFKINNEYKLFKSIDDVYNYIKYIEDNRDKLEYEIDGMVIKVNSYNLQEKLGFTSRIPKWATAYKFKAQEIETLLEDIFITIGRTGKATPNAKLKSVILAGSKVSFASLHNEDMIKEKDIRINDIVTVRKAGDIIPEVVKSNISLRKKESVPYLFPEECPECNHKLIRYENEAAHYCINSNCKAKIIESIAYYASRDCMNIEGMGARNVEILYHNKIINSIVDLYLLHEKKNEILTIEGFGEKSFEKLIESIEKSKSNSVEKLICALGIRQIGEKASKVLAKEYRSLNNIMNASTDELINIKDMGKISAKSLFDYFNDEANKDIINKLIEFGVNIDYIQTEEKQSIFTNKTVVLTGTLENIDRKEAIKILEVNGAKISSSVSKNTNYLICGSNAGSKLIKAQDLNIPIITEDEFLSEIK